MRKGWLLLVASMLFAGTASAVPIASYEGELVEDVTFFGQVSEPSLTGSPNDDFWWFYGNAGDVVTLTVNRLEASLDPAFRLYFGMGTDTAILIFLTSADDEIAEFPGYEGPWRDAQLSGFTLPYAGYYTVQVWSYASGDPGADGVYDYQITLGTPPTGPVYGVPEPAMAALLGLGLVGLGVFQHRKPRI